MDFNVLANLILEENRRAHKQRMGILYERSLPFMEDYFRGVLQGICNEAGKGCGLSYELYVQRISQAIDFYLLSISHDEVVGQVLKLAKSDFDYCASPDIGKLEGDGCCPHGIDLGCCSAGCGSY